MYPYFTAEEPGAWRNPWICDGMGVCVGGRIGTQQSDSRVHHDLETLMFLLTAKDLDVLLNLVQTQFYNWSTIDRLKVSLQVRIC